MVTKGGIYQVNSRDLVVNDLRKYFNYFFETKGFTVAAREEVSPQAVRSAGLIRGEAYGPAIIIHGIMPRAGTVYVGELLRRHPDLYAYPHQLWEMPALQLTGDILQLQKKFGLAYKMGMDKLGANDFLPLFGAALMAHMHSLAPPQQRVLTKIPSVQYLNYFSSMFPYENLLILVRDGRDVVHSTLRTWGKMNFLKVCLRWNRSARIVLETVEALSTRQSGSFYLARYEDALETPAVFVRTICGRFGLDDDRYPYEQIDEIRVIGSSKLENQGEVTWQHLEKPTNFRPTGYWREWSSVRKLIFKAVAGKSLVDLGYAQDLNW